MTLPLLTEADLNGHLGRLPQWVSDGKVISKQYKFKDFVQSLQFVNFVGVSAESVNHHPDIDIRYDKVTLSLTTHDSGGITLSDIELAAAADDYADSILR